MREHFRSDAGLLTVDGDRFRSGRRREAIRLGLQYVPQELDLCTDLSVWENIAIADRELEAVGFVLPPGSARRRTKELLIRVGASDIPAWALVKELSFAERQMVAIARAMASNPHFVVFDEPTASLGQSESRVVQEVVKSVADQGAACAFISHRTAEVLETCDRVIVLRDGLVVDTKSTSGIDDEGLEHAMFGAFADVADTSRASHRGEREALAIDNATLTGAFSDVTLRVQTGEVLGLYGLAGAGIGALLRGVASLVPLTSGTICVRDDSGDSHFVRNIATARRHGLSFLSMDRKAEGIYPGHATALNIESERLTERIWYSTRRIFDAADKIGALCGLYADHELYSRPIERLSGGQQQKSLLARRLAGGSHTWVMDEPFGGIDVSSKKDITSLIRERTASGDAVLMSTGDVTDLVAVCDRALVLRGGKIVGEVDAVEDDGTVSWTDDRIAQLRAYAVR